MAGAAYLVPDWKFLFHLFSCVHLLTFVALHFVCESPRWLISVGRVGEAKAVLEDVAKKNGRTGACVDAKDLDAAPAERKEHFSVVFRVAIQ